MFTAIRLLVRGNAGSVTRKNEDWKLAKKRETKQHKMESSKSRSTQLKMLEAIGMNEETKAALRKLFLRFAPDGKMTVSGFNSFLETCPGLIDDLSRAECYFRALDDKYQGYIQLGQFMMGLSAMDVNTNHGGEYGEIRCRYIFRFYCRDHNARAIMDGTDFRHLASDIVLNKDRTQNLSTTEVKKQAGYYFQHFESNFTLSKFMQKVGTLQLRGTSCLFRSQRPVVDWLYDIAPGTSNNESSQADDSGKLQTRRTTAIQTEPEFHVSPFVVSITEGGCIVERLSQMNGAAPGEDAASAVTQKTVSVLRQQQTIRMDDDRDKAISLATDMLRGLDYFFWPYMLKPKSSASKSHGDDGPVRQKPPMDWCDVKRSRLAQCLVKLCHYLQPILSAEPRCLELKQPIHVLGDIHGNYEDLHSFERLFWPLGPEHSLASILFLGDYVDRGIYGLEVVAYLFSLKLMAPDKVFLLRGNHELREQQMAFNFKDECLVKLDDNNGEAVWNAINACFDSMPMAAIIENKIFCVHGGIPHSRYLQRIPGVKTNDLPGMLNELCPHPAPTFNVSSAPWEMLWNDPVWDDVTSSQLDAYGFRPNTRRGTGHEFSEKALDQFLSRYNLTHIIRAHQVQNAGFQVRYSAKCLTVFSSSSYSGLENEAAVVIVDGNTIKPVRIARQADQASVEKENCGKRRNSDSNAGVMTSKNVGMFAKR